MSIDMENYTKRVITLRASMLLRLAGYKRTALMELGEILEDTANRFLDLADQIRQQVIVDQRAASERERQNKEKKLH